MDCWISFRAQGLLACFLNHHLKKILLALPLRPFYLHRDLIPITRLSTRETISHRLPPLLIRWMVVRTKGTLFLKYDDLGTLLRFVVRVDSCTKVSLVMIY